MTRKKNNQTPHLLDPTDDPTPTDSPDELADTRELRRVVGLNAAEDPGSARLAAAADELQNTGEFVALGGEPIGGAAPSEGRANGVAGLPAAPDDQVSFWLNHLASEIERLQAKWTQVDGELRLREGRIEELRRELAAKDVTVEGLVRDLTAVGAAKSESEQVLASMESRLTALVSDQAQSEARLAENSRQLDVAKANDAQLQLQLAAARSQIERLQEQSAQEKQATVEADARAHELAAGNSELRGTIEVLESYIDRRNESWSQLNAKLTEYQDSLVIAERAAKDRDRKSAEQEQAKEQLFQQVLELERRCADLTGGLKERETANADLQTQLAQQIDAASQLRSELEIRGKGMAETAAQLDRQTQTTA
ncbi:MAG TPA: hypothetical protein VJA26_17985, partial [Gammaproteobacteria bacterium]|nr:hypothetical protein [Gammaproteobacteria bacterium]